MRKEILLVLMIGIVNLGSLLLTGCSIITKEVYVTTRLPIIETVERPLLNENDEPYEIIQTLMNYALTLEDAIDIYNEYAKEQNLKSGYEF